MNKELPPEGEEKLNKQEGHFEPLRDNDGEKPEKGWRSIVDLEKETGDIVPEAERKIESAAKELGLSAEELEAASEEFGLDNKLQDIREKAEEAGREAVGVSEKDLGEDGQPEIIIRVRPEKMDRLVELLSANSEPGTVFPFGETEEDLYIIPDRLLYGLLKDNGLIDAEISGSEPVFADLKEGEEKYYPSLDVKVYKQNGQTIIERKISEKKDLRSNPMDDEQTVVEIKEAKPEIDSENSAKKAIFEKEKSMLPAAVMEATSAPVWVVRIRPDYDGLRALLAENGYGIKEHPGREGVPFQILAEDIYEIDDMTFAIETDSPIYQKLKEKNLVKTDFYVEDATKERLAEIEMEEAGELYSKGKDKDGRTVHKRGSYLVYEEEL